MSLADRESPASAIVRRQGDWTHVTMVGPKRAKALLTAGWPAGLLAGWRGPKYRLVVLGQFAGSTGRDACRRPSIGNLGAKRESAGHETRDAGPRPVDTIARAGSVTAACWRRGSRSARLERRRGGVHSQQDCRGRGV